MVRNVVTLISACESKFALIGADDNETTEPEAVAGDTTVHTGAALETIEDSDEASADSETSSDDGLEMGRNRKAKHDTPSGPSEAVNRLRPAREIASGDAELLELLLSRIREPICDLQHRVDEAIDLIMVCLAYCFDVDKLPNGALAPKGIMLEEIDIRVDLFENAIAVFDESSTEALSKAASMEKEKLGHVC